MENVNEEELEISPNLKNILLSEVNLIRDTINIFLVFTEGAAKTAIKFLEKNDNSIINE